MANTGTVVVLSPQIGINWRGVWSALTTYTLNDAVQYNGAAYICIAPSVSAQPDITTTSWSLMASASNLVPSLLPTSQPATSGVLWNDGGFLAVS